MANKTKLWRDIGAKRGALARQLQADGDIRSALTQRQNIRQSKSFMRGLMSVVPSQLLQNLFLRAGITKMA